MDLKSLFKESKKAFNRHPYPSIKERKATLKKLKTLLQKEASLIAAAIDKDYKGRVSYESYLLEIYPSIQSVNYNLRHLSRWVKAKSRALSIWFRPATAKVIAQPLGVVGIVVPWNYPLYLTVSPLVSAISAGNRVMVKLSEESVHFGPLFKQLIEQYKIEGVEIITGDVEVAKAFCALPFNHLLYTGSGQVGKMVMNQASHSLTPVTLELGGKSPVIVDSDVKMENLSRLFIGKFMNAGQTCVAPDYVFLPKDKKEAFISFAKDFVKRHYPNIDEAKDYTAIINQRRYQHLCRLKENAKQSGAECIALGKDNESTKCLAPTLLFNIDMSMDIMNEEIFGPLLPIIEYQSIDEVINHINQHDRPLALYYFGKDKSVIKQLTTQTHSGSLTVNDTIVQVANDNLPFGGVGASGMGHYHGLEGFNTFSKLKPVFYQRNFSSFSLLYPPYKGFIRFFLRKVAGLKI